MLKRPDPLRLLEWYDRHRRDLPWRARPGETPDPYAVWLSEVMLQQTTVPAVKSYYEKFLRLWPTVGDLAAAPVEDVMKAWAGLGYYSRARNLHACAQAIANDHGGHFPTDEHALRKLPGIGAYTAAAIAAIAFGRRAVVVDGNVERIVTRVFAIDEVMPKARPAIRSATDTITPDTRAGDFAQAMMDLGSTICVPRRPLCALCPFMDACVARSTGEMERFPVKAAKSERPRRAGAVFYLRRADGAVLVRTRPSKGLLGGMLEIPGTPWEIDFDVSSALEQAPALATWRRAPGVVEHVFTHFALTLSVFSAEAPMGANTPDGMRWAPESSLSEEAFPTVFRKALAHARRA